MIRTVDIDTAGADYTSMNNARAGEQGDIVAGGYSLVIQGFAMEDTSSSSFVAANWTTDATHFITLQAAPGARHKGRWSTDAYRIKVSGGFVECITVDVDFTVVDGILFEHNMTAANAAGLDIRDPDCTVTDCISRYTGTGTAPVGFKSAGADRNKWRNLLAYDFDDGASAGAGYQISTSVSGDFWVYNCGAVDCWTGYLETFNDPVLINCYAQGANDGFNGTYDAASDFNLSDLAADAPGGNSKNSTSIIFVDAANDDYHLSGTDTGARDSGTDLSADADQPFSDDLDGNERTGDWDIGPNEYLAHEVKRLIKPSGQGGDYTSTPTWETGETGDLVHDGRVAIGSIEGDWTSDAETTAVVIGGSWTPDPTRNVILRTVGEARHDGKWTATAHRWIMGGASGPTIQAVPYVEFDGLQVNITPTTPGRRGIWVANQEAIGSKIHHCIVVLDPGASSTGHIGIQTLTVDDCVIYNNLVYDFNLTGSRGYSFETQTGGATETTTVTVYNNNAIDCLTGMEVEVDGTKVCTVLAKNNLIQDTTTAYATTGAGATFHASSTTNLADDATAPGTSPINNASVLFINAGADDYHLDGTDTAAHQAGTDLSADGTFPFNDDIDDEARFDPWDVGFDQVPLLTGGIPAMFNRGLA